MEETIRFKSGPLTLDGRISEGLGTRGVVLTHPHPLYGGEMDNPVVEALQQAFCNRGYTTLRFNFRGVGRSQGSHDNGVGERQDVQAAIACLAGRGLPWIDLAGYSFGAWVNGHLSPSDSGFRRSVMVSPPVAFMDHSTMGPMEGLSLVVAGSQDEIGPVETIRRLLPEWNAQAALEVIEGADHFYWGYLDALKAAVDRHLQG